MLATSAAARWPQLSRQGQVVASRSCPSCPPCSRRGELSGPASSAPPPPWQSQSPPGPLIQSPSSCRESPEFGQFLKFYGHGIVITIKTVPPLCWESGWASCWEATCRKGGLRLPQWSYATHWVGRWMIELIWNSQFYKWRTPAEEREVVEGFTEGHWGKVFQKLKSNANQWSGCFNLTYVEDQHCTGMRSK